MSGHLEDFRFKYLNPNFEMASILDGKRPVFFSGGTKVFR